VIKDGKRGAQCGRNYSRRTLTKDVLKFLLVLVVCLGAGFLGTVFGGLVVGRISWRACRGGWNGDE
jgi:hypothetical protein